VSIAQAVFLLELGQTDRQKDKHTDVTDRHTHADDVCVCLSLCTTAVHKTANRTVVIIFPPNLQTIIRAQMLCTGAYTDIMITNNNGGICTKNIQLYYLKLEKPSLKRSHQPFSGWCYLFTVSNQVLFCLYNIR